MGSADVVQTANSSVLNRFYVLLETGLCGVVTDDFPWIRKVSSILFTFMEVDTSCED